MDTYEEGLKDGRVEVAREVWDIMSLHLDVPYGVNADNPEDVLNALDNWLLETRAVIQKLLGRFDWDY